MFIFFPILALAGLIALATRGSKASSASSPARVAGWLGDGDEPSPLEVLDGYARAGCTPPAFVIECAIAQAQLMGSTDAVSAIVEAYILPQLQAAAGVERTAVWQARDANPPSHRHPHHHAHAHHHPEHHRGASQVMPAPFRAPTRTAPIYQPAPPIDVPSAPHHHPHAPFGGHSHDREAFGMPQQHPISTPVHPGFPQPFGAPTGHPAQSVMDHFGQPNNAGHPGHPGPQGVHPGPSGGHPHDHHAHDHNAQANQPLGPGGGGRPRNIGRPEDVKVEIVPPIHALHPRAQAASAAQTMASTPGAPGAPHVHRVTSAGTLTVSGRSCPIEGVAADRWQAFCEQVSREQPTYVTDRHVGRYRQRRDRLTELGIDPRTVEQDPGAQDSALAADMGDAYHHAQASGLMQEHCGAAIQVPGAPTAVPVTRSGVLGVIQAAGLEGAAAWLEQPADRTRFPGTTQAFLRTNGVF